MLILICIVVAGVISPLPPTAPAAGETQKIKVETLDDLPRRSYAIPGKVSELVRSDEQFKRFADKVRADLESDLATYDIEDKATLRQWNGTLVNLNILDGRYDAALECLASLRGLMDKPALKLTTGLSAEPAITALRETGGDTSDPAYQTIFRRELTDKVAGFPWDVVQDEIERYKGTMEMLSENFAMGMAQTRLDPVVEQSGELSRDLAANVVDIRAILTLILPVREDIVDVLQQAIDAHRVAKIDIWKERSVALSVSDPCEKVTIAIWDTGIDVSVFKKHLFTNPGEHPNGEDTDGNGFVDDVHGIAHDLEWDRVPELLYPLGDAEPRAQQLLDEIKGFFDLQAAIDSPEAAALRKKFSEMPPADVRPFIEDLSRCILYVHGTHVAGIATEGNPFVLLLTARLTADYRTIPQKPTMELARKSAEAFKETVTYFETHGVRVVNMSWGIGLRQVESDLEANGVGADAAERAKMAREIFDVMKAGLYEAIQSAPDILFVTAAGNVDADVAFDEDCPAAFDLPNVIAVGAVDQTGTETSFTSFGDRVEVYASGFEVESFVPGGRRMAFSGTSMSSPNVVNVAAKLIAIDPTLTPAQVIDLIKGGADEVQGSKPLLLLNPKLTVDLLRERRANRSP
jgi:hypothetical protein